MVQFSLACAAKSAQLSLFKVVHIEAVKPNKSISTLKAEVEKCHSKLKKKKKIGATHLIL